MTLALDIAESFRFSTLLNPGFLLLLIGVAAVLAAEICARAPGVMSISTGEVLARVQGKHSRWSRWIPALLRAAGLTLLIIALARPVGGLEPIQEETETMDIMLALDVSGSMKALDFTIDGQRRNRLEVSQMVLRDFIEDRRRQSDDATVDRLGLILFAGIAWSTCPLTMDYSIVDRKVEEAYIDTEDPRKQGTAIGSALGLAVSRLRHSDAETRIVVLLTDGRNNTGELDPITAAHLAADHGIRVYTIGAGSYGEVPIPQRTVFGERLVPVHIPIDDETNQKIADITGGRYYRATDTAGLQEAYKEINELERSEVQVTEYHHTEERFFPYAATGGAILALALFGRRFWFDPLP